MRGTLNRISHRMLPISRRRFVFTGDFLRERNNRAYFRPKKIVCGNKDQARSVTSGEKRRLETAVEPPVEGFNGGFQDNQVFGHKEHIYSGFFRLFANYQHGITVECRFSLIL